MRLSTHFTLEEMVKSQTALRKGIANTPLEPEVIRLTALCENVLEPVRMQFGPTVITSGYRCARLNRAIGGAVSSQHVRGEAADFECVRASNLEVAAWIRDMLEFDQLILEYYRQGVPNSGWVHCSYVAGEGLNRNMVLTKERGRDYQLGLPEEN